MAPVFASDKLSPLGRLSVVTFRPPAGAAGGAAGAGGLGAAGGGELLAVEVAASSSLSSTLSSRRSEKPKTKAMASVLGLQISENSVLKTGPRTSSRTAKLATRMPAHAPSAPDTGLRKSVVQEAP